MSHPTHCTSAEGETLQSKDRTPLRPPNLVRSPLFSLYSSLFLDTCGPSFTYSLPQPFEGSPPPTGSVSCGCPLRFRVPGSRSSFETEVRHHERPGDTKLLGRAPLSLKDSSENSVGRVCRHGKERTLQWSSPGEGRGRSSYPESAEDSHLGSSRGHCLRVY